MFVDRPLATLFYWSRTLTLARSLFLHAVSLSHSADIAHCTFYNVNSILLIEQILSLWVMVVVVVVLLRFLFGFQWFCWQILCVMHWWYLRIKWTMMTIITRTEDSTAQRDTARQHQKQTKLNQTRILRILCNCLLVCLFVHLFVHSVGRTECMYLMRQNAILFARNKMLRVAQNLDRLIMSLSI